MKIPAARPLALLLGLLLFLLGLVAAGLVARDWLRRSERYTIAFTDVECTPPPDDKPKDFLLEVQYKADLPDRLNLLDDDLTQRLSAAFARHAWVEKVERVQIVNRAQVRVSLVYRLPVLAVPYEGTLRAVDRCGILLPKSASTLSLPVFKGPAPPPSGQPGTLWGDEAVEAAARAAGGADR